jgi:hypothetical protein
MRRQLSRRHSLSLGIFGGFGLLAASSCSGEVSPTGGGDGGTAGSGGSTGNPDGSSGSGGGGGSTGGSSGSGGSTGGSGGSGGGTGGSGGSGGGTGGSGGSGGGTGGSGGGGTGGSGGAGGATGGSGGSGGATGGSGGSAGSTGGSAGTGGAGGSGGGKDAGSGGDGASGCAAAITAIISMNHGHALSIPAADVTAGVDKIYNARGTSAHDHFVQVTSADFAMLKSGGTVIKKSCNGGDHEYALSCGTPTRQPGAPTCSAGDECGLTMGMLCPP